MIEYPAPVNRPVKPWDSLEERLTSEALLRATDPAIAQPSLQRLFPPRFGMAHNQPTIEQVLHLARGYPDKRAYFSGVVSTFEATSRPSMGWI